jgi:hypothetical protein
MEGVFEFSIWDMGNVGMFDEKGVSNVGPRQSFNSSFQMLVVTRANMPILTSNHIFLNRGRV